MLVKQTPSNNNDELLFCLLRVLEEPSETAGGTAGPHYTCSRCLLSDHDSARTILRVVFVARFPKIGAATICIDSIIFRSVGSTIIEDQAMC